MEFFRWYNSFPSFFLHCGSDNQISTLDFSGPCRWIFLFVVILWDHRIHWPPTAHPEPLSPSSLRFNGPASAQFYFRSLSPYIIKASSIGIVLNPGLRCCSLVLRWFFSISFVSHWSLPSCSHPSADNASPPRLEGNGGASVRMNARLG